MHRNALLVLSLLLIPLAALADEPAEGTPFRLGRLSGTLPGKWSQEVKTHDGFSILVLRNPVGVSIILFDVFETTAPVDEVVRTLIATTSGSLERVHPQELEPVVSHGLPRKNAVQFVTVRSEGAMLEQTWFGYEVKGGRQAALMTTSVEIADLVNRDLMDTLYHLHLSAPEKAHVRAKAKEAEARATREEEEELRAQQKQKSRTAATGTRPRVTSPNGAACYANDQCSSGFCHIKTCRTPGDLSTYKSPGQMMQDMNSDIGRRMSEW